MTLWEFFAACLRRWPFVLVGVLVTGIAAFGVMSDKGVYYTRTQIVFLAPSSSYYPNTLATQSEDIIDTAGVVAKRITGPGPVTKYASPDVTLIGEGIRDGWSLGLPDTGGQWGTNFQSQILNLEIVAPARETVLARQTAMLQRVQDELNALQRERGVEPINYITVQAAPRSTVIYHVGGSKPRSLGMVAALGLGVTAALVVIAERAGRGGPRPFRLRRKGLSAPSFEGARSPRAKVGQARPVRDDVLH